MISFKGSSQLELLPHFSAIEERKNSYLDKPAIAWSVAAAEQAAAKSPRTPSFSCMANAYATMFVYCSSQEKFVHKIAPFFDTLACPCVIRPILKGSGDKINCFYQHSLKWNRRHGGYTSILYKLFTIQVCLCENINRMADISIQWIKNPI